LIIKRFFSGLDLAGIKRFIRGLVMINQFETTPLRQLFALRYQVYCVERGFLSQDEYPEGEESDSFDLNAVHFAAIDQAERVLGSVRLVYNVPGLGFPYQGYCRDLFLGSRELPTENAAEISRLVVSKDFCRRLEDRDSDLLRLRSGNHRADAERRHSSQRKKIVLSLYKAMYQYSLETGINYWYATMEQSLVRLLTRFGVRFFPIGPTSDYFGPVIPHCIKVTDLQDSVERFSAPLFTWFNETGDDIDAAIRVVQVTASSSPATTGH
jgi:N-acyl amino acid synthase of PEP-CTERM/exosortase system